MSGECHVCGEHAVDCHCWEVRDDSKQTTVYVLFYLSKTYNELLGVFSTQELANKAYNNAILAMGSMANFTGLAICVRKLDEDHEW